MVLLMVDKPVIVVAQCVGKLGSASVSSVMLAGKVIMIRFLLGDDAVLGLLEWGVVSVAEATVAPLCVWSGFRDVRKHVTNRFHQLTLLTVNFFFSGMLH